MAERIKKYYQKIDEILKSGEINNIDELIKEHLIQIGFFQHERLVHLLVTLSFAMMSIYCVVSSIKLESLLFLIMSIILLVVLGFYIKHYFLLENTIQKMYYQYDEMIKIKNNNK